MVKFVEVDLPVIASTDNVLMLSSYLSC